MCRLSELGGKYLSFKREGARSFSQPLSTVFSAVLFVCKEFGWRIDISDKKSGQIMAVTRPSMFSWGERVCIKVSKVDDKEIRVHVLSESSWDLVSLFKDYRNIKNLFEELEKKLSQA